MAITEPTINTKLADVLRTLHPRWAEAEALRSQQTQRIQGQPGRQCDLELAVPMAAPVVIEAEIAPAHNVEAEANSRLGQKLIGGEDEVETAVALRYPSRLRTIDESSLEEELRAAADLEWVILYSTAPRRPTSGWIQGTVAELASMLEILALSPKVLKEAADKLQEGIEGIAQFIRCLPNASVSRKKIAENLYQSEDIQTWRMAASVITNAFVCQETISSTHGICGIKDLPLGWMGKMTREGVLDTWEKILEINYWPVFKIAFDLLRSFNVSHGNAVSRRSANLALELLDVGVGQVQNMTGQMFGQLISDRKFLATFYTLPSSARLLAQLAVDRLAVDWADSTAIKRLQIADFACGTGALLSAAYESVAANARRAGLDDAKLHSKMIEDVLVGADIMPAAAHLTTTMLSTAHPQVGFDKSGIHVVAYGKQPDGEIAIGSLHLLRDKGAVALWSTAKQVTGKGESSEEVDPFALGDESCDLVIMNPPFTRPTNHEGAKKLIGEGKQVAMVPSFAGFGTSTEEQSQMSQALKNVVAKTKSQSKSLKGVWASHGNAGLASNFVDLADAKLRPGGVLALVLPFVAVSGPSWANFRELIGRRYQDVKFITIAAAGSKKQAFSADTGIAEVLVVATKRTDPETRQETHQLAECAWVSLKKRPLDLIDAFLVSNAINGQKAHLAVTPLTTGGEILGYQVAAGVNDFEFAGISDPELALSANAFTRNVLRLPRHDEFELPLTPLEVLGKPGPVDRDINGQDNRTGVFRGPFDLEDPEAPGASDIYPILWGHNVASGRESQMEVLHDKVGRPRHNMRKKANWVFQRATRLHINSDFGLGSQSLGACLTPHRAIGGRAWPSFELATSDWEATICLYLNSTLGFVARWSVSNRQQIGRACLSVSTLGNIPVIDPRQLTEAEIGTLGGIFEVFSKRKLRPAAEAHKDEVRQELDEAILCDSLQLHTKAGITREDFLEALSLLRGQWCSEPSVHAKRKK